jgi:predicted site-specific integrase-resolvase
MEQSNNVEPMTMVEVCEALGISRMTAHRRIREGVIKPLPKSPGQRRAHRLLFDRAEIERVKQEGTE